MTGASPAAKPIITIVVALRPKMTRNSGYMSTIGAAASAPTHVSHASRMMLNRWSRAPIGMPMPASNRLAHRTSCAVCQKRCSTFSSTMMRGIATMISEGSGTIKRLTIPARIASSTIPIRISTVTAPIEPAPIRESIHCLSGDLLTAWLFLRARATRHRVSRGLLPPAGRARSRQHSVRRHRC